MRNVLQFLAMCLCILSSSDAQWQFAGLDSSKVHVIAGVGQDVWAGTENRGMYLSTNNGTTWLQRSNGLHNLFIKSFVSNGTVLFAGSNAGGVSISTNNGANWQNASTGLPGAGTGVHWLTAIGATVFAGTNGAGVYRTTNAGGVWEAVNNGLTNTFVHALAVSGAMLLAGTGGTTTEGGVFASTNNGASWMLLSGSTFGGVRSLVVNGSNIFAGCNGTGVFASTDNGASWNQRNSGLTTTTARAMSMSGSLLYVGTNGGGMFVSSNSRASWTASNSGLGNPFILSVFLNGAYVFAGTAGGVYRLTLPSDVKEVDTAVPERFGLDQNYPNPFNPVTTIRFRVASADFASLTVHDITGRQVAGLVNQFLAPGTYVTHFDAAMLASGVYLLQLRTRSFTATKKMVLSR